MAPTVVVVALVVVLASAFDSTRSQPLSFCTNFVPEGANRNYDLTWWYSRSFQLAYKEWRWNFGLCSSLPTECPAINSDRNGCDWPGSAGICQSWYSSGQRQFCNAFATLTPSVIAFQLGRESGFIMQLQPAAEVKMICNSTKPPSFDITNYSGAEFVIHHCSACAKDDPNWCGPEFPFYNAVLYSFFSPSASNDSFSVRKLPGDLQATQPAANTFKLSGIFQARTNGTISFAISSGNGVHATAVVSFPAADTAVLAITDDVTHVAYDCGTPKTQLSSFQLQCNLPFGGSFSLVGSVRST
eukprot:TRINITY_DN14132_c0_g1_i1.p1 TRINITY_DN14132_c0_g1~~TRINITY_DN14132_c0_g1_i1.p1  ORF type:complete len:316 (-),score=38.29 TRINITY_DN14132_c0_g1_i1:124-1023(-)